MLEVYKAPQGKDGLHASAAIVQHILNNRDTLEIKDGSIYVCKDNVLRLALLGYEYLKIVENIQDGKVSLFVLFYDTKDDRYEEFAVQFNVGGFTC